MMIYAKKTLAAIKNKPFGWVIILIAGTLSFALLLKLSYRITGSDDTVFPVQIQPFENIIEWVQYRYSSWSGRIFAEAFMYIFSPAPLWMWKIVTLISYVIFSLYLFLFYRLFTRNYSPQKDSFMMAIITAMPFLIHPEVLFSGVFWVTGSMAYFWITTIGLVAIYPALFYLRHRRLPTLPYVALGVVSLVIASCSQEQVGAVLVGLYLSFTAYIFYEKYYKKSDYRHTYIIASLSVLAIVAFSISVLAPGNESRLAIETRTWLPDFYTTPGIDRIQYAYRWFLEAIINHMAIFLAIVLGAGAIVTLRKKRDNLSNTLGTLSGLIACGLAFKGHESLLHWFTFYAAWKPQLPGKFSYLLFLPWLAVIALTLAALFLVFQKTKRALLLSLLLLAALASTIIVTLSPTMYASGWRTIFVPAVIMMIISYLIICDLYDRFETGRKYILLFIYLLASSGYVLILLNYIQNTSYVS